MTVLEGINRRRGRLAGWATGLVVLTAVAGCGGGQTSAAEAPPPTTVVASSSPSPSPTPSTATQQASTQPTSKASTTAASSTTEPPNTEPSTTKPSTTAPAPSCGVRKSAPEISAAAARLPRVPGIDAGWNPTPLESNYDPCATLSTALVTIQGATGSSPIQALMFHEGKYLGTGTTKAYGFTSLNTAKTTSDTVVLDYQTGKSCTGCSDGITTAVRYHWDGHRVVMLDQPPQ